LFGHLAASGAVRPREPGALEAARGGTLLLDDVDHLSVRLQSELMAALGGPMTSRAPRLISTTSHDLKKLMEAGAFRRTFITTSMSCRSRYRLWAVGARTFRFCFSFSGTGKRTKRRHKTLLTRSHRTARDHRLPGNVRQLFELVKQNVALSHGKIMSKEFVERSLGADMKKVPSYQEARENFTRDYLTSNLQATSGKRQRIGSARQAQSHRFLQTVGSPSGCAGRLQENRYRRISSSETRRLAGEEFRPRPAIPSWCGAPKTLARTHLTPR